MTDDKPVDASLLLARAMVPRVEEETLGSKLKYYRGPLIGFAIVAVLSLGLLIAGFSPQCTTFEQYGTRYCTQAVWGGTIHWKEPIR